MPKSETFCVVVPTRNAPSSRCIEIIHDLAKAAADASFDYNLKLLFIVNDSAPGFSANLEHDLKAETIAGIDVDVVFADRDYATVEDNIVKNLERNPDKLHDKFICIGNSDMIDFVALGGAIDFMNSAELELLLVGINNSESWDDRIIRTSYATPPLTLFNKNNLLAPEPSTGSDIFRRIILGYGPVDYAAYIGCQIYTKSFFRDFCAISLPESLYSLPIRTLELTERRPYKLGFYPKVVATRIDALNFGPDDPRPPENWWVTKSRTDKGLSKDIGMSVITNSIHLNENAFATLVRAGMVSIRRAHPSYVFRPYLNHTVRQFFETFVRAQKEPEYNFAASEVKDIVRFGERLGKVDVGLDAAAQVKVCNWLKRFNLTDGTSGMEALKEWLQEARSVFQTLEGRKDFGSRPGTTNLKLALITGVTGFLGSHIARQLVDQGTTVIGLKRVTSSLDQLTKMDLIGKIELHDFEQESINLFSLLKGRRVDALFHTAACTTFIATETEAINLINTNVRFPCRLLDQAKKSHLVGSFINAGTSWQSADGQNYTPLNFYAATKEAFEKALSLSASDKFPCATLRLFDTYGPGDKRGKIIDLLVRATLEGQPLDMSPGEQQMYFLHIRDVASAFLQAAELAVAGKAIGHQIYSVPARDSIRLRDTADLIGQLAGKTPPVNWGKRDYHPNQIMTPVTSHPQVPGWQPTMSLWDGVGEVIRDHLARQRQP